MLPQEHKSKARSLNDTPGALPELNIYNRVGPKFPTGASFTPEENEKLYEDDMSKYYAWLICRIIGSEGMQPVHALGGFISVTGETPVKKVNIILLYSNQQSNHRVLHSAITYQKIRSNYC